MPRPLRWSTYASFARGMVQDVPRHLLPDDAVWDAENVFVKRSGALAKRGGTTQALSSVSASPAAVASRIGMLRSSNVDAASRLFVASINSTFVAAHFASSASTVAATVWNSGGFDSVASLGDPFQHFNTLVFPATSITNHDRGAIFYGGSASTNITGPSLGTPLTITVTAGSKTVTGIAAGDISRFAVGDFVNFHSVTPTPKYSYTGRVISVGSTTIDVEPTPAVSFTNENTDPGGSFVAYAGLPGPSGTGYVSPYVGDAKCGCSFQNRVVFGNLYWMNNSYSASAMQLIPNRIAWSVLPTDQVTSGTTPATWSGMLWINKIGFTPYDFVDVQQIEEIVSLRPVGQGQLLILGSVGVSLLVGDLQTITAVTGDVSFSIQALSTTVGCISERSVQTTPAGVIWASREGVYAFDGSRIQNLMSDRIARLWFDTYSGATIYGSATVGMHYYISTSAGGLLYNIQTGAWTKVSGLDLYGSAVDRGSGRVYGVDGSAMNDTRYAFRLDTLLSPSSSATTDYHSNTAVAATIKTKTYIEGDPHNLNRFRHTAPVVTVKGSNNVTITATPGLEGEETSSTLGTITPSATGPQRKRYDHQIIAPAIGYTISTAAATDEMELAEIRVGSNQLRPGRTT